MKVLTKTTLQAKLHAAENEAEACRNRAKRAEKRLEDLEEQYRSTIDDLTTEVQESKESVEKLVTRSNAYQDRYVKLAQENHELRVELTHSNNQQSDLRSKLGTVRRDLAISEARHYAVSVVLSQTIEKLIEK